MKFNSTGTLTDWQFDDIRIIEPLHAKEDGGLRGGAYLCIPNFEALSPPFHLKHGEYRITPCDADLPHQKNITSPAHHNWGSVFSSTHWEETQANHTKTLVVTTTLRALTDNTLLRPGFHPYFSITPNSFIDTGKIRIEVESLPHDSMRPYRAESLSAGIKLTTAHYHVTLTCHVAPESENHNTAFAIWSDKKHQYVCIEPVIGNPLGADGLPTPLLLAKDEQLTLTFILTAEKMRMVKNSPTITA